MANQDQVQPPVVLATPEETAKHVEAIQAEWSKWVAVDSIYVGSALAYNRGSIVPVSNVKRHGYDKQGLVVEIESKEGQALIKALHEASLAEPTAVEAQPITLGVPIISTQK
jgi:hypothetical protein